MRLFLRNAPVPDCLSAEGTLSMPHRLIALFALVCFGLSAGGCELFTSSPKTKPAKKKSTSTSTSKKKDYEEVLMPLQTGSTIQRRTYVLRGPESEKKPAKQKKDSAAAKPKASPKPEAEPEAAPSPTEESTPTADRFR
jgi:hypothetical protein